jgi:hypothetical protein
LFCIYLLLGNAATPAIVWSDALSKHHNAGNSDIIYSDDKYCYLVYQVENPTGNYVVCNFVKTDKSGKELLNQEIKTEAKKSTLIRAVPTGQGNFLILFTGEFNKEKMARIQGLIVDQQGNVIAKEKTIYEAPYKKAIVRYFSTINNVQSEVSPDRSKLALVFVNGAPNNKYNLLEIDMKMDTLINVEGAVPYDSILTPGRYAFTSYLNAHTFSTYNLHKRSEQRFCVDNNGNVFLINAKSNIIKHSSSGVTAIPFITGSHHIDQPLMCLNANGDLVLSGLYADGNGDYTGTFTSKLLSGTANFAGADFKPFTTETKKVLDQDVMDSRQGSASWGLWIKEPGKRTSADVLYSGKLVTTANFSYYITEIYYFSMTISSTAGPNGGPTATSISNFKSNFITIIDSTGKIVTDLPVVKDQMTAHTPVYGSFCCFTKGDELCLLFNDKETNVAATNESGTEQFVFGKRSVGMLVTIGPDGKSKREVLFHNKDLHAVMEPETMVPFSNHVQILATHFNNSSLIDDQYHIGRIDLK